MLHRNIIINMLKSLVLLAFFTGLEVYYVKSDQARIIGGKETDVSKFPYQVVVKFDGAFQCGGSIISDTWILTASHCVLNKIPADLAVQAGVTNWRKEEGQHIQVKEIYQNPNFTKRWYDYDIALLRLEDPLTFGPKVSPVTLAEDGFDPEPNTEVTASGWGLTEDGDYPDVLRKVTVSIVPRDYCAKQYEGLGNDGHPDVTPRMTCAYGEGIDTCSGDSGGPLVNSNKVQVGIVSWAYECAKPGYPGVYSNIGSLRYYIKDITGI